MIEPPLGELTEVKDEIPHPADVIRVQVSRKGVDGIHGSIELPAAITGTFFEDVKCVIWIHARNPLIGKHL